MDARVRRGTRNSSHASVVLGRCEHGRCISRTGQSATPRSEGGPVANILREVHRDQQYLDRKPGDLRDRGGGCLWPELLVLGWLPLGRRSWAGRVGGDEFLQRMERPGPRGMTWTDVDGYQPGPGVRKLEGRPLGCRTSLLKTSEMNGKPRMAPSEDPEDADRISSRGRHPILTRIRPSAVPAAAWAGSRTTRRGASADRHGRRWRVRVRTSGAPWLRLGTRSRL